LKRRNDFFIKVTNITFLTHLGWPIKSLRTQKPRVSSFATGSPWTAKTNSAAKIIGGTKKTRALSPWPWHFRFTKLTSIAVIADIEPCGVSKWQEGGADQIEE
jgi:hypothetical protein